MGCFEHNSSIGRLGEGDGEGRQEEQGLTAPFFIDPEGISEDDERWKTVHDPCLYLFHRIEDYGESWEMTQ